MRDSLLLVIRFTVSKEVAFMENKKKPIPLVKKPVSACETCEFYDYDEYYDEYGCSITLDEDEYADFIGQRTGRCPYYRYYDEYASVRKQN